MEKTGVMLVGALGHLAGTVVMGALCLKSGLSAGTGMVTELEEFSGLGLLGPGAMVFGGWDVRAGSLSGNVKDLLRSTPGFHEDALAHIEYELRPLSRNVYPGTVLNCGEAIRDLAGKGTAREGETPMALVDQLRGDIRDFRARNGVDSVIVVNLASTEPPIEIQDCHGDPAAFMERLEDGDCSILRAGTLYSCAAILEGAPYINFTPSNAALPPALVKLASAKGVPVMGNDGKTGETLVKSALAPMFKCRNLEVLSWEGFNILGNMDGKVLDHPENRESKIRTKDRILKEILGYAPHSGVHINHVPSLGDRKTAWDFIHFRGFLGVEMSLQFVWQGCDSILAAPLVIDLVRLADLARRRGEAGLMPQLAPFFKEPLGIDEHRLFAQFQMLLDYASRITR